MSSLDAPENADAACLLRFIKEQHVMSQWHLERQLEEQHARLCKVLEEKIELMAAEVRLSMPRADATEAKDTLVFPTATVTAPPTQLQEGMDFSHGEAMPSAPAYVQVEISKAKADIEKHVAKPQNDFPEGEDQGAAKAKAMANPKAPRRSKTLMRIKNEHRKNDTMLQKFFNSGKADILLALVIIVSTAITFADLEVTSREASAALGLVPEDSGNEGLLDAFTVMDYLVTTFFVTELGLRIWAFGIDLFDDKLAVLDALIVVVAAVDSIVLKQISDRESNMGFIRLIRYVKLVRSLRLVRTMQLFHQLRVLIHTITHSMVSLFWSMIILFTCQLVSALMLVQLIHGEILNTSYDYELRLWMNQRWGSPGKALWTMFEVTFSGSWPNHVRPLVEEVSLFYAFFFGLYVGGVVFAIIRVITALFLKETLDQASKDAEIAVGNLQKQKERFTEALKELFFEADTSGDGMISWSEFCQLLSHERTNDYLSTLELDFHETEVLFKLLDDGDGLVSFEEFAGGITRLKGQARSLDVYTILNLQRRLVKDVHGMKSNMDRLSSLTQSLTASAAMQAQELRPELSVGPLVVSIAHGTEVRPPEIL